jgi:hypothetical protein
MNDVGSNKNPTSYGWDSSRQALRVEVNNSQSGSKPNNNTPTWCGDSSF